MKEKINGKVLHEMQFGSCFNDNTESQTNEWVNKEFFFEIEMNRNSQTNESKGDVLWSYHSGIFDQHA